jgi:hypothetical protein
MKQRIKLFPVFLFVLIGLTSYAQELKLKGGLNNSWITYYNHGVNLSDEYSAKLGYQLGASAILPVRGNLSINLGAVMMKRNYNWIQIPEPNDEWHFDITRWYLEFPVLVRRAFYFSEFSLYGELGPYVSIGLSNNESYKHYFNGEFDKEGNIDHQWGTDDYNLKRFDYGYNVGFGLLFKKLEIGINYEQGFIDFESSGWLESKNRVFMLNCAYTLFSFNKQN